MIRRSIALIAIVSGIALALVGCGIPSDSTPRPITLDSTTTTIEDVPAP